jgi:HTH-type transcriptional regulator/antitoxin HigA
MNVHVIRNDDDLTAALRDIDTLWQAEPGSPDGDKRDALVALVSAYEDRHYAIPKVSGLEVLKFCMEQNDRTQTDLARLLGSRSRASEILSGRRALTLEQIRTLAKEWRIPAAALLEIEVA